MRWLITGGAGQLAFDLLAAIEPGDFVVAPRRRDLDITDAEQVAAAVADVDPDVVVNTAAYTAVDAAEDAEDDAYRVNAYGPEILAAALVPGRARLIHVSTDYVFDGGSDGGGSDRPPRAPYEVDDPTAPRSAYGRTKVAGEQAVLAGLPERGYVVRTAWLYGAGGPNFVATMLRMEAERDTVSVVDDQHGSPTWAADLAGGLIALARADVPGGVLHATNAGVTTWFGLAQAVFEAVGADPARVRPVDSLQFVRPAPRPACSVLSGARWAEVGLTPLPAWRPSLAAALAVMAPGRRAGQPA